MYPIGCEYVSTTRSLQTATAIAVPSPKQYILRCQQRQYGYSIQIIPAKMHNGYACDINGAGKARIERHPQRHAVLADAQRAPRAAHALQHADLTCFRDSTAMWPSNMTGLDPLSRQGLMPCPPIPIWIGHTNDSRHERRERDQQGYWTESILRGRRIHLLLILRESRGRIAQL